jgi:hypothetical protein
MLSGRSPHVQLSGIPQNMATFKDPTRCFAPLEVVERLLEIRRELGFEETIYLERCQQLTDFLGRLRI